jgi:1-acyl-sn-glycerol-3-phosphate acyltransferase
MIGYKFTRLLLKLLVRLTLNITVYGEENVPNSQFSGIIVASNHIGVFDVPLVYNFINRDDIILLVAEKYQKYVWARWFAKQLNIIWVDRFNADFNALRVAFKRLRRGGVMVLAPEGTRSQSGALLEGRPGASYLATKANVPIIPVALMGTEDWLVKSQITRLRRSKVIIKVGKPFTLPPIKGEYRENSLQDHTDEIMLRIAALLPPAYRGVYANHPRLHEFLPT